MATRELVTLHLPPCKLFCEDLIHQRDICVFQSVGQFGDTNTVVYTYWLCLFSEGKCDFAHAHTLHSIWFTFKDTTQVYQTHSGLSQFQCLDGAKIDIKVFISEVNCISCK